MCRRWARWDRTVKGLVTGWGEWEERSAPPIVREEK